MSNHGSTLWAITSFFNPVGYRRRLANYRRFRSALGVPLATIELGFDGRFELEEQDSDLLVRVGDGDVMWQKERLLNLLLQQLPPECEYVAWLDCDVLLQDPEWPQRAVEQLTTVPLVQLFSKLRYLGPDEELKDGTLYMPGTAADVLGGLSAAYAYDDNRTAGTQAHGMAWAARRELLDRHGFYDRAVIGGGDTAVGGAAYGVQEVVMNLWQMNAEQREHYSQWADRFYDDVQGQVGALDGELQHLWHGEIKDRHYGQRQIDLKPHRFNPHTDIRPGADGAWRWATDKPALHALLRHYFYGRHEDGKRVST